MKYILLLIATALTISACHKSNDNGSASPDVSNFSAAASATSYPFTFAGGVIVSSSSLSDGMYKVIYKYYSSLGLEYTQSPLFQFQDNKGTFPIAADNTQDHVWLDSIVGAVNDVASPISQIVDMVDSNGLVTATGGHTFRGVEVEEAYDSPGTLNFTGIDDFPDSIGFESLQIIIPVFAMQFAPLTYTVNSNSPIFASVAIFSQGNGGSFTDIAKSVHGTITVTATNPQITGSFSCTCSDSTTLIGTFSGPSL